MAIRTDYSGYRNIFNSHNLKIDSSEKFLKKIKTYETISKIILIIILAFASILFYDLATGNTKEAKSIAIFFVLTLIIGSILRVIFNEMKRINISKLDNLIFNNFLIKQIKIFYTFEELKNFTYEKIEHITTKLVNSKNVNQTIIDLSFIAFEKKAEGIIISSNSQSSLTVGTIGKKTGGSINTHIINSTEAILIKNIRTNENIDQTKDLNYWFELKEKGAITEDEYEVKKKNFLS
ncbi:hypothetical protein L5F33_10075 [Aliarcobacter butzleri]|uniref:hypothetical protein n=1 Tax=Aliarcobacter butzleri TaxID=28197 RepID=UPI001EE06CEF|nr:hypothetical protein [Aliarcobacter butzleri]MCG3670613.1 hypothetical protein [Aliarcobacter butzleri]